MRIETKKTLSWIALLLGLGGTLVFWFTYLFEGYMLPLLPMWIGCQILLIFTPFQLRRCYRLQPMPALGQWQLTTADLVATTVLFGSLLALYHAILERQLIPVGFVLAACTSSLFILGLLSASRKGYGDRYVFAGAVASCLVGLVATSAFVLMTIVVLLTPTAGFAYFVDWIFLREPVPWPDRLLRHSLYYLPIGIALFGLFRVRNRVDAVQPIAVTSDAGT